MDKVAVVTDSSSCVPKEVVEQYGVHILPLILIFEERSYRDGVDITSREFYELLKKAKKLPTTSSPSPGEYLEAFRKLSKQANGILCITLPPHLGMAFNSATEAREIAREALPKVDITVFPSKGPALAGVHCTSGGSCGSFGRRPGSGYPGCSGYDGKGECDLHVGYPLLSG